MSYHVVPTAFEALIRQQAGLFHRDQARTAGYSAKMVRTRIRHGTWLEVGHGVLGVAGGPEADDRRLWRAHLAAGPLSVISHESAAARKRFKGVPAGPMVVTRPHGSWSGWEDVVVHQLDDVGPHHVYRDRGLPFTTVVRTLFDLSAVCGRARLEVAVEEELARGRATVADLARLVEELARPGKPGITRMQDVLDRQVGNRPGASRLEWLMENVLRSIPGLRYTTETPLPTTGEVTGVVDFTIAEARLVIEADGRRWHERRRDMVRDRDRDRDNAAAAAGWQVSRYLWEHVVDDPDGTRRTIEQIHHQRCQLLATR